jgi:hypothetical protein
MSFRDNLVRGGPFPASSLPYRVYHTVRGGRPTLPAFSLTHNDMVGPSLALFAKGGIPHRSPHADPSPAQRDGW